MSRCIFDQSGNRRYYDGEGRLHRTDGPAVEWPDGTRFWWWHGLMHREDGPAIEYPDGSCKWCHYGSIHRTDGPAVLRSSGAVEWWLYGTCYLYPYEWLEATEISPLTRTQLLLQYGDILSRSHEESDSEW